VPYSDEQGKDWLIPRIVEHAPTSILDIGVGAGTYAQRLRPRLPGTHFAGIEVFEAYVPMFNLTDWYDHLILGDARDVEWPPADVVILGDVLEHMRYDDAVAMWDRARAHAAKAVFVSLPIIHAPQGAEFGNEHERHLHTWSHDDVLALPGVIDSWAGSVLGAYHISPVTSA
jgi:hypothetical protein